MSQVDHILRMTIAAAYEYNLSQQEMKELQSKLSLHNFKMSYDETYGFDDLDDEL